MLEDLKKLGKMVEEEAGLQNFVIFETLEEVIFKNEKYPIYSFTIGNLAPEAPCLFITGGIHGLERVGAQLAWSLLKTTLDRLLWDQSLQDLYKKIRLVVVPLVNPVGFFNYRRSNGNGVDLMRNSPTLSSEKVHFLLGGQCYTNKLPWYQGILNVLEKENKALYKKFIGSTQQSKCVISLDFHSGFGMKDRLWFPFSFSSTPFDQLAELTALFDLFERIHPYHIYKIEPQSKSYLINGDLWDYLYLELKKINPDTVFIPLTLEMGSWTWVRKNPWQLFSRQGIFNPMKAHRLKRTYRRHNLLYDFLLKALYSHSFWASLDSHQKKNCHHTGVSRWYE